ncbi:response regulator transcription factor [Chitinophaga sp.]|uniref:response regulator n=1 Tax=Chitinophaga sp. TaxID=1869181 RepID=UPI002613D6F9|nr:response regulator transcription factor [uncultured Chitinophaga sp.]
MNSITIALVDDHPAILNGLQMILQGFPDVSVTGAWQNGDQLLGGLQVQAPQVLFLDIQLPGQDGLALCRRVSADYPAVRVIIFTNVEDKHTIRTAFQNGAAGYLLKTAGSREIREAIDTVTAGEQYVHNELKDQMFQQIIQRKPSRYAPSLTRREKEILGYIAQGLSNQEIADKLSLSVRTIENHRYNLMQKLDVKNTAALVRKAMELGLAS